MQLKAIFLLYKSGWSIDKILRLCFEKMGPLYNAPNASGPTPSIAPVYKEFLNVANLFRDLEKINALNIFMEEINNEEIMTFKISSSAKNISATRDLNNLFKTPVNNLRFQL